MLKNAIGLFIFTLILLVLFLPSYSRLQDLKEKNAQHEQEIEALKKRKLELTQEYRRLKEDPDYLEKVAREKMGLIKEGEVIYQLVPANVQK